MNAAVNAKVTELKDSVTGNVQGLKTKVDGMQTSVKELAGNVKGVIITNRKRNKDMTTLEATVSGLKNDLAGITGTVGSTQTAVNKLERLGEKEEREKKEEAIANITKSRIARQNISDIMAKEREISSKNVDIAAETNAAQKEELFVELKTLKLDLEDLKARK